MKRFRLIHVMILTTLILSMVGCQSAPLPPVDPYNDPSATDVAATSTPMPTPAPVAYLDRPTFAPDQAQYFDLAQETLALTPEEYELLTQNGFVLSDRLAFADFTTAYGYIYWKDLPVIVTTDSILQTIQKNYDDILIFLEENTLAPLLTQMLTAVCSRVKSESPPKNLKSLYHDLEIYLAVPLILLNTDTYDGNLWMPIELPSVEYNTPDAAPYVKMAGEAQEAGKVDLFGGDPYQVDFTLFRPRGHYTGNAYLARYFRAMMWLSQADFRFVTYDPLTSAPEAHPDTIAAATLLRDKLDEAGMRANWEQFDALLTAFVGRSDNMRLSDLDTFLRDAGLDSPEAVQKADPNALFTLLTANDYGWQRITGQLLARHIGNASPESMPRPVSFALMGQRFAVDSYAMSNLVYDRLWVGGRAVERPFPSPLDVMAVLGNNRAQAHLTGELAQYGYADNLNVLQSAVDGYDADFWSSSAYNRWLAMLRTLDTPTVAENYPQSMRTAAWADKMLHTQLASWAQLRHNNLLYVKQSVTMGVVCEYPEGYVEPYPEFFAAVVEYANAGAALFTDMNRNTLDAPSGYVQTQQANILTYFTDLADIAARLETMAEKELRQEPFDDEEVLFLKSIVVQKDLEVAGCGGPTYREEWDGWYTRLFMGEDSTPAMIVDVHTNPESLLPPAGVLHVGTGPVATLIFIAETDEGPTVYVGPAFTYYETLELGWPAIRLQDEEWRMRLYYGEDRPQPPAWTQSFRVPNDADWQFLSVPLQ